MKEGVKKGALPPSPAYSIWIAETKKGDDEGGNLVLSDTIDYSIVSHAHLIMNYASCPFSSSFPPPPCRRFFFRSYRTKRTAHNGRLSTVPTMIRNGRAANNQQQQQQSEIDVRHETSVGAMR